MNQHASRRKLMVIGGNEDKQGECSILREFIRLAGGTRARVLLLTVSAEDSRHMADPYLRLFRRLGVKNARHIDVRGRADTYSSLTISAAESATAILIAADDQLDVNSLLGGTELDKTLRRKSDQGTVLAGTGAGAAMLSHAMISDAVNSSSPLAGTVCLSPGLGYLSGSIVDTHFAQRRHHARLLSAIAQYPHDLGIGIDEDTAITLRANGFTVSGAGSVTIIDVGAATFSNASEAFHKTPLGLYNIRVHVLPAGHGFDLENRVPLPPGGQTRPGPIRRTPSRRVRSRALANKVSH